MAANAIKNSYLKGLNCNYHTFFFSFVTIQNTVFFPRLSQYQSFRQTYFICTCCLAGSDDNLKTIYTLHDNDKYLWLEE